MSWLRFIPRPPNRSVDSMLEPNQWLSVLWLIALGMVALWYAGRCLRHSDYGFWESCLYAPTYLTGRLLWRVQFTNEAPAELSGGALLVANHKSSVDPFFVQLAARRRVHWMVAKEYCDHFIFGPLLKVLQVIPTNRSGMDTASTKRAVRLTSHGRLVGMFPEGRLNHTREPLVSIRGGAALVAMRSSVPMIPLYIKGSPYRKTVWSPLIIPARVVITFGVPIYPPCESEESPQAAPGLQSADGAPPVSQKDCQQTAADEMMLEWGRQVVAMAGHPTYPIELASRRKNRRREQRNREGQTDPS
jgi:1-acyl-sn-glycerol-3-phosphate acyltransferase